MKKLALILLLAASVAAQTLSPDVKQYVKVGTADVILTHVRIIDGTGAAAREDQTVFIAGGKIQTIRDTNASVIVDGRLRCSPQPSCSTTIDATGMTLLPGLV